MGAAVPSQVSLAEVEGLRDLPPLITLKETSAITGLSYRTVKRLRESGRVRSVRCGRSVLVYTESVLELLTGRPSREGRPSAPVAPAGAGLGGQGDPGPDAGPGPGPGGRHEAAPPAGVVPGAAAPAGGGRQWSVEELLRGYESGDGRVGAA